MYANVCITLCNKLHKFHLHMSWILNLNIVVNLNYRHATRSWEIELPRGMRRSKESLREASARELKEETGYMGRIESVTPPLYTSPGMLSESCYLTYVSIDEAIVENRFPQEENEPGESIEVIVLEAGKVLPYLEVASKNGDGIDIKLFTYFYKNEK